jgi:Cu-Zn family superoxide dismutase
LLILPAAFASVWIWLAVAGAGSALARAQLIDLKGDVVGQVTFSQAGDHASRVRFAVHGLLGGFHGFHIHVNGVCDASHGFPSVGGHYDHANREQPFDGEMPSILVGSNGVGAGSFLTDRFTVADVEGRSVVVHAFSDNFANVPIGNAKDQYFPNGPNAVAKTSATGNAGPPIACGVIRKIR